MTLLAASRLSDASPPVRELVEVADDGSLRGWRSQGGVVGRFGGRVPDPDALRSLATAAAGDRPPAPGTFPLDATVESAEAGGAELAVRAGSQPPAGPWGELLVAARSLLDEVLPGSPVAAVALVVDEAAGVRLEHRGTEPLVLELGSGWAEVTRWRDGDPVAGTETASLGLGRVEAGPGWSAAIPLEVPRGEPGDLVTASVWLVADDAGVHVPVVVTGRSRD